MGTPSELYRNNKSTGVNIQRPYEVNPVENLRLLTKEYKQNPSVKEQYCFSSFYFNSIAVKTSTAIRCCFSSEPNATLEVKKL